MKPNPAALAEKLAASLVNDLYGAAKSAIAPRIAAWRNTRALKKLAAKLWDIRLVKTVWHFDAAVDLHTFYYASSLAVGEERLRINDVADLPVATNIVIQGTIGQGKSIFLRFLACRIFQSAKQIPVLIELRRLHGKDLLQQVAQELDALGFKADPDIVEYLMDDGRVVLLLDGFDEVPQDLRDSLIDKLEQLSRKYERTRILVTSRPDSAIQRSPLFSVLHLAPLQAAECEGIIYKLVGDETVASRLVSSIRGNHTVSALLTTPLMVTLLVFRYRATQSFPEHEAAFYGQLFDLLLNRHDKTKPGFMRTRKSGLGDVDLERAFDALCFVTRKNSTVSIARPGLLEHAATALQFAAIKADPALFITDVIEITCLIVEEAGECRFVHKSVQEYHAARWVKGQPDKSAAKFYEAMNSHWRDWVQELTFLSLIDRYRFTKYFLLPQAQNFEPTASPAAEATSTIQVIAEMFAQDEIGYDGKGDLDYLRFATDYTWLIRRRFDPHEYFQAARDVSVRKLPKTIVRRSKETRAGNQTDSYIIVKDLLTVAPEVGAPLAALGKRWIDDIVSSVRQARAYVASQDAAASIFEFDPSRVEDSPGGGGRRLTR